ncbi:MAG: hypothetical protein C4325_13855 [Blastocatellia bacterium]
MTQSLGQKLRAAREAKGLTISEVAEQTRISPMYIESIERDDYKPLLFVRLPAASVLMSTKRLPTTNRSRPSFGPKGKNCSENIPRRF